MFRKAAMMRNEMLADGFTDNGGAIHSASRILDILCHRVCYPVGSGTSTTTATILLIGVE